MLLVTLQEDCLPTSHILVGHREEVSIFPEMSLIALYITVFMTGTLSLHLGQPAVALPPTVLMPLTSHSGAFLEPQRHRGPRDLSGPMHAHWLVWLGLSGCRLHAASCTQVFCWLALCIVIHAADANFHI